MTDLKKNAKKQAETAIATARDIAEESTVNAKAAAVKAHATAKDAEKVINAGKNILTIENSEKKSIFNISGLQPYLLQVLCWELFNRMKYSGRDIMTEFDLNETIKNIIGKDSTFTDYKSIIGEEGEDYIYGLALAHRATIDRRKYVSIREIQEALARVGRPHERTDR